MKLFTHLITITVLTICCLTTSAQTTWSQVEWDNITETDEIMITMTADNGTGTTYAMNNDGTSTPIAVIVTYAAGSITIGTSGYTMDNLLWNLNTSTGRIYPKGSTTTWLYTTNSNSGVRIGNNTTNGYSWSIDGNYLKTNEGSNDRWLGVYKNNPDWRAYTNITGNTANQVVKFYKKSGATPPTVATPTFTPAAGSILYPQLITMNCDTDGSTIYYTTNGDEPTTSSNVYSTPIQVLNTTTIKAIAVKSDMTNSPIASASYNFAQNEQYVRINNLSALPAGSRVIFAARFDENSNNYYAMKNTTSGKPVGVLFTSSTIGSNEVLPSTIMESADTYYFTVGINGSNYTFTNAAGELIGYASGTNFTTGGSNTEWIVSNETSSAGSMVPNYSAFTVTNKGINSRAFALNTSHNFGPYATSNKNTSSYNFFVDIFVKNDASASSYTIDNVNELVALRIGINSGESFTYKGNSIPARGVGIHFKLTTDLDLSSVCGASVGSGTSWTPIGNDPNWFKGHFHGGGHSISNLYINASTSNWQGLFGYVDSGSIDSLNLVNTNVTGQDFVGGVCGYNSATSTISHCTNSGSVSGNDDVGGVCGWNYNSTISHCFNSGSVSGSDIVGGVCGLHTESSISHCSNSGSVSGTGNYVGGVIGYNNFDSEINNCLNSGSVSGTGECVGGVCGRNEDNSKISHCTNSGSVSGGNYVGGVCGSNYNNSEISHCLNSGSISGTGDYVGGVCGDNYSNCTIKYCLNSGSVSGSSNVGGVIGRNYSSTINYCYYDKQLCIVGGIDGSDKLHQAEGKRTTEITGSSPTGLTGFTATDWAFANGMYPRPKGIENSDAAIVAATPIFLAATNATTYETVNSVASNFTVGIGNDVTWETVGNGTALTVSGENVTIDGISKDTLVAKKGGIIYKTVALYVSNPQNPFTIDNENDLQMFRDSINSGVAFTYKGNYVPAGGDNTYFKLTTDLDLSSVCGEGVGSGTSWTPIGSSSKNFKGHFHGGGHSISNLYINAPTSDYQGLFGCVYGGSIDSLNLVNTNVTGRSRVGSVCGSAVNFTISHCSNSGSVSGTSYYVGGVCGSTDNATISHCTNSGSVSGTSYYVGGVCGENNNYSEISHCINSGSISGTGTYVGGVCGSNDENSTTSHCINSGSVSGSSRVAGVCAYNNATISYCYYDKQMCTVGGIGGYSNSSDVAGKAEGKLTTEITGASPTGLTGFTATDWTFAEGMYPRPKGIENSDAAIVAATPIFLAATNATTYETVNSVVTNFNVGTRNGVTWEASGNGLTVSGEDVTIVTCGNDMLVAKKNNIIYKTVALKVPYSPTNPYSIDNVADLQTLRDGINTGTDFTYKGNSVPAFGEGIHFRLTADLDLSSVCGDGVSNWTPIGNYMSSVQDYQFKGYFHGGGHSISNLYINAPDSYYQGLFGYVNGGSIDSLNLVNTNVTGFYYVGGVCGYNLNTSTISHCLNSGSVSGTGNYVGGVCGSTYNNSTISHCINSGSVSGKSFYTGGVCGYNYDNSTISHCLNSGGVSGIRSVGGVCGFNNDNSSISHCINSGSVSGSFYVGGVSGDNYNATINYCYYDKQMCTIGGIGDDTKSSDVAGKAEGKLTTEMTGASPTGLTDFTATDWFFADGMYPRPKGIENSDVAIVAATPIFLAATNATTYETVNSVASNFTIGIGNDVTWEASGNGTALTVSGENVTIDGISKDTLVAKKGGIIYKTVVLYVPNPQNPFTIDNENDLQMFRDSINSGVAFTYKGNYVPAGGDNTYFKLTADLDLSSVCGASVGSGTSWTPIGYINVSQNRPFKGHFHGGGHSISNLYINKTTSDYQGLFGYVEGGSIDSLNLVNTNVTGEDYVGGVCGRTVNSTISYCSNSGSVSGNDDVGGVCGWNYYSTISHCFNSGSVSGTANSVGGVCGYNHDYSVINNCLNIGSVSGSSNVGGVCGYNYDNSTISHCLNSGSVSGTANIVGGVCGYNHDYSVINNCLNSGSVSGSSNVGGVCGDNNNATIEHCYYDKQICTVGGIDDSDEENHAEGKLTIDLIGFNMDQILYADYWFYAEYMYPRPKGIKNSDAAIVAATPIFLAATDATTYETVNSVASNFTIGIGNGVTWEASGNGFTVSGENVTIVTCGNDMLVAKKNNIIYKTVALKVPYSPTHPYSIDNVADLQTLRDGINSGAAFTYKGNSVPAGGEGIHFKLTADLDLSSVCGASVGSGTSWTPIGSSSKYFKAYFDGDGHTISNLYIYEPGSSYQGLFGYVKDGNIRNLNLVNTIVAANNYVGSICGYSNTSIINNCSNSGSVSGTGDYVGGVCGHNRLHSTITNCTSSGSVSGDEYVGGVCGWNYNYSSISHCTNSGSVSGTKWVGGVSGDNQMNSETIHCTNSGSVSGSSNVGGVSGYNEGSTITNCYYDKQMCTVGGINGSDEANQAVGKLTTEMTGMALQAVLGTDNWTFADGMYPCPKGIENTDAAIVATTPIFLAATNATTYETVNRVASNFTYSGADSVAWSSTQSRISFSHGNATLVSVGTDAITAIYGNAEKRIAITTVIGGTAFPYTIDNVADLQDFRDGINSGAAFTYKGNDVPACGEGIHFKLTADLDLSSVCGASVGSGTSWTPIGNFSQQFKGHLHGGGHSISNLYINAPTGQYQGLFGYVKGGSIDSLNLVNTIVTGTFYIGGVCGFNDDNSEINHCSISGSISGIQYVGGVCGYNYSNSTISYCTYSGSVSGTGYYVGGVCGYNYTNSTISHCTHSGSVSGSGRYVSGVCGYNKTNSTISYCTHSGSVSGISNYVGGVCGYNDDNSEINHCSNSGSVSGTRDNVGGVCGTNYNSSTISYCSNSGNVSGNKDNTGGVCGNNANADINHCFNSGSVSGTSNYVGGVCGRINNSTISYSYYDKQLCTVGGIDGSDVADQAEGKLTTEMTGTALQTALGTADWTFADGMYPRPKGIENTDAAIVAATPIFLDATDATIYETVQMVTTNFTVGIGNSVTWEASGNALTVSGANVTIDGFNLDTLVAKKGGVIYKTVVLYVPNPQNPLTIDNVEELQAFRDGINSGAAFTYKGYYVPAGGDFNTYFRLTADLDLSSVCGANVGSGTSWTEIGNNSKKFKGHFHGGGHSISNLYINAPTSNVQGLFGYVEGGSIDSLNLVNTNVTAYSYVGGVSGYNRNAEISHCSNSGSVSGTHHYIGGVCGYNYANSSISHCSNSGSVNGTWNYTGGVCGYNENSSTISHCLNSGIIIGNVHVGGVCGYNDNSSTISHCLNSGSVVTTNYYVGGVCGYNNNSSTISYCLNIGRVSGTTNLGGVCGYNTASTISYCYNDKQMCTVGGIDSGNLPGQAEDKLTTEMTGTALQTALGTDNWTFADGMYPCPKGIENTDADIVATTPIFLAVTGSTYETVNRVASNFTYSGADSVAWSSTQGYLTFSNGNVSLNQTGYDTITAMYGNANKSIAVRILKPFTASISGIDTICEGNDVTLTANSDAVSPAYQWYENGYILTDSTSQTLTIAPTTTSVYKIRITETHINAGHWSEAEKTVTVKHSNTVDTTAVACNSFTWYGTEYTSTPDIAPTHTFTNAAGCDSVVTLNLTVNHSNTVDTTAVACNSFTWYGTEYTSTPEVAPTHTFTNAAGCDSVVTLYLTINSYATPTLQASAASICNGENTLLTATDGSDEYRWFVEGESTPFATTNTNTYTVSPTTTTNYTVKVVNRDTIETGVINSIPFDSLAVGDIITTDNIAVKPADWAVVAAAPYNKAAWGVVYHISDTLLRVVGMNENYKAWGVVGESVPGIFSSSDETAALADYNGIRNTQALLTAYPTANYVANWCAAQGGYLPALGELKAMYNKKDSVNASMAVIQGLALFGDVDHYWSSSEYSYYNAWYVISSGTVYNFDKNYYYHYGRAVCAYAPGTIRQFNHSTIYTACESEPSEAIRVAVNHSNTVDTTAVACDSFTWYGTEYTSTPAVAPTHTFTNAAGCDSVVTLNLTVNHSNTGDTTAVACDSFTWYGTEYTSTPAIAPTHTFTNAAGCDSVVTLYLTINSYATPTLQASAASICNGENTLLTATDGSDEYRWFVEGESTPFATTTNNTYTVSPTTTTNYTVKVVNRDTIETGVINSIPFDSLAVGDIITTDNIAVKPADWAVVAAAPYNKTAWGVVYHISDTLLRVVGMNENYKAWGVLGGSVPGIFSSSDETAALADYNGIRNTQALLTAYPTANYVANWCAAQGGYLPALGELKAMYNKKDSVNASMAVIQGLALFGDVDHYWSSSEYSYTNAWSVNDSGYVNRHYKSGNYSYGRAVCAYAPGTIRQFNHSTIYTACESEPSEAIRVAVNHSNTVDTTAVACNSFTWYGTEYTSTPAIAPTHTFTNAAGCDSVVTLNLTVNHSNTVDTTAVACNSFTWYGTEYTSTPEVAPTHTFTNAAGCDSVVTLYLTINSYATPTLQASAASICNGENTLLTATDGSDEYQWFVEGESTPFATTDTNTYTVSPTTTTNYTVKVVNRDTIETGVINSIPFDSLAVGDIITTDNIAVKPADWAVVAAAPYNKAAWGVVYHISDTLLRVVGMNENKKAWGVVSVSVPGIFSSSDETAALADYNGIRNTQALLTAYPTANYVANWCAAQGGYLPALGELKAMYNKKDSVNASMAVIQGLALFGDVDYYWSSSEYSYFSAWSVYRNGSVFNDYKTSTNLYGRAVCAYAPGTIRQFNHSTIYTACESEPSEAIRVAVNYSNTGDTTAVACDSFTWYGTEYTSTPAVAPTHTFTNAAGCDSVVTLNLTVNHSNTGDITVVACNSFTWYGTEYTSTPAIAPTHTFTNAAGCDSVVTLNLTVNYSNTGDTTAVACDSFTWYGTEYTSTPEVAPTHTFTNAAGCDSVVTLYLTINSYATPTLQASAASICNGENTLLTATDGSDEYRWFVEGESTPFATTTTNTYTVSPTTTTNYTVKVVNRNTIETGVINSIPFDSLAVGDIITTDNIAVKPADWAVVAAAPYNKNAWGVVYHISDTLLRVVGMNENYKAWGVVGGSVPGIFSSEVQAAALADYNGIRNTQALLTAYPTANYVANWCAAQGGYLPALGELKAMYNKKDSVNASMAVIQGFALFGDVDYYWSSSEYSSNNAWYVYTNGRVYDNFKNYYNFYGRAVCAYAPGTIRQFNHSTIYTACESEPSEAIRVAVNYSNTGDTTAVACDSFTWYGTEYTSTPAVAPTHTFTNAAGCDSVVTLNLTVNYSNTGDTTAVACNSFTWYGTEYTSTPAVAPTHTFTNAAGCDSVVTLNLTVNYSNTGDTTAVACDSFTWYGTEYTSTPAIAPTHTLTNAAGCDSVVTLNLTVNHSNTGDTTAVACDSFTWYGTEYTSTPAIAPTHTLTNAAGCDSVVTLNLTVNYSNTGDTTAVACDSFTWYGTEYTSTPAIAPTHTLTNAAGCDSVVTLNLTVNYSNTGDTTAVACDRFTWYGNEYTSTPTTAPTHTFTNAAGCDSVVTLNLTINESETYEFSETACDSYIWNQETYTTSGDYVQTFQNALGCDSVVTLHLTINESETYEFSETACNSYTWNNTNYTESGDYEQTFQNALGCDSVVTLHLTINESETYEFSETACDSYTWNNTNYTESGDYEQTFQNALGCDSVVTLHLTINESETYEFSETACNSYTWNNTNYTESGDYVQTFQNALGCDSVVTLHLTINESETYEFSETACNSYTWNNTNYTESGDYEQTFQNALGCDSVVTLHLTINESETYEFSETVCDSYTWNNTNYTESGDYEQTFQNALGCDSTVTLHLTINESETNEFAATTCDEYTWNNEIYTTSGDYVQTFQNALGCDSVVTLHLTINYSETYEWAASACEEYTWNNEIYTTSGDYVQTFQNALGCDSVVTLHLTINESETYEFSATACDSYIWNQETYTASGDYVQTFQNALGCDSVVTLHLTINESETYEFSATACDSYIWNQETYTASGDYVQTLQNALGCDSVVTLHLTINESETYEFTATACDSYIWNQETYTTSGDYVQTFQNALGCDSVVTLHLTINESETYEFSETACEEYVWNEETYTESGDYVQTFQNALGCDSVVTLHLTINESETYEFSETACNSYTWNNTNYTESGDYVQTFQNALGCDSVVTLHLTINESETYEFSETACDSYTWNNEIYTTSGDYVQTFQNALGCDSVVTLHLTINESETYEFSEIACNSYTWNNTNYTESGDYVQTFQNALSCDSVVTLHLTINESETNEFAASACEEYTWNDAIYTESGDYVQTFQNALGCDSVVTLHLTINESETYEFSETACDSYIWNQETYTESGDYVQTFQNALGCDSVVTLHLTINESETYEFTATACDSYIWNNTNYTESGDYVQTFQNALGCDSTVTLHLTINYSETYEWAATACDSYTWNNEIYTTSGDYVQTFQNAFGCDSVVTLHLTINESETNEFAATTCDEYTWNNEIYTTSGDYVQTFQNALGCDSTVTLHLTINYSETYEWAATACDSYTWNNEIYTTSGDYVQSFQNALGCDSTVTLHLTINESETNEFAATTCDEYTWNNEIYTTSGDYVQTFQNALGCDSVVTLHLTINESETYEFTATACEEYTWNNEIYTTSGDYVQTFQNALGCDSTVTLHLTINYSETYEFSATACEEYTWNNETYTESGDYVQEFVNAHGCDSVVTLHLTINKPEIIEVNGSLTICKNSWTTLEVESSYANSFVWTVPDNFEMVQTESPNVIWLKGLEAGIAEISVYGINDECGNSEVYNFDITIAPTYHEYYEVEACQGGSYSGYGFNDLTMEGIYSQSHTSVDGCDSIVTLSLQFVEAESQTIAVTACNSYVWNNEVLTTSGIWSQTLTNINGCDSIVTLYLTLYHDVNIEMEQTVCDSYTWNNETYTESGDYVQNFTTSAGCDSVVTLHLTIVPSYETNLEASICFGDYYNFFGVMLNESGQYEHALNALNGCDSTIILTLIVNELPDVQIEGETMIHLGESATLTATGAETYQWSTGETTEEIIVTPTYTRTYNVIGTDGNGCSNSASHVVEVTLGIETVNADSFKVYPNPTQQRVIIEGDHMQQIELYNALGQRVHWMNQIDSESSVELNVERYETGSYLIRITTVDGKTLTKRLIIAR